MFLYRAINENGDYIEDRTDRTREGLVEDLEEAGYFLLEYKKEKINFYKKLNLKELYIFSSNLSLILSSGIEFSIGLSLVGDSINNRKIQGIIGNIETDIHKGLLPSRAIKNTGVFPDFFVNVIKTGEISGALDIAFKDLSLYYKDKYEFKNKLINIMIYPLIILFITGLSMILMFKFIVPSFIEIYKEFDHDLPKITKFIIKISKLLNTNLIGIVIFLLLGSYIFYLMRKNEKFKYRLDKLKYRIPMFSNIYIDIKTFEITNILKILIGKNMEFYRSLEIIENMENNLYLREKINLGITSLELGSKFSEGIEAEKIFSKIFKVFIAIGEETGELEKSIVNSNNYLKNRINNNLEKLEILIEPLVLLILGLIIGVLVIGIVTPMFNIIDFII